ncbi:MAG TPA: hypothetical protein VMZ00_13515, partial [Sporichthya sp.]|nr:hypothetical protein [Sporichthya sp.]
YEPVMPDFSMQVEMPQWTPLPAEDVIDELVLAVLERPAVLAVPKVEMPEWTPLPETDQPDTEMPEMVLSQIVLDELRPAPEPAPSAATEPISEIEPLPDGSVLAAAAALAELESMLADIPPVPAGVVVDPAEELLADAREILSPVAWASDESDGASIPAQPSEAVLTLAAAALLGGARSAADASLEAPPELAPEPAPRPERPADLAPDLARRLAGLEVLRNSGIMSEDEFLAAEAEILESVSTG